MNRTDILNAVNNKIFVRNGFLTFIVCFGYYFPAAYAAMIEAGLTEKLYDIKQKTQLINLINSLDF